MCGINGFIGIQLDEDQARAELHHATDTLVHRGPDDVGSWIDAEAGVALGHRRLSIIDLSHAGHQPMISSTGRYVITYNGEIYNFTELRKELQQEGVAFRGHSDTEVAVEAIAKWGPRKAVERFAGMFAFAVWDRHDRVLHLVRDRFGEKPLYYADTGELFLFGSELKALRAHPGFRPRISRDALVLYFRFNCIPAPFTIYDNTFKVPPGSIVSIRAGKAPITTPYWSAAEVFASARAAGFDGSEPEAVDALEELLSRSVAQRMIADVPLGAFLSGGIDSSTIVAMMQAQGSGPVRTFTIGSHEAEFNEADVAKQVAHHLGTDHTELYVSPAEAAEVIPRLPTIYDEPFADSSQIPTFLISQLTRKHVKVALSGDGGDELFGGYNRYVLARRALRVMESVPGSLRHWAGRILLSQPSHRWDRLGSTASRILPREAAMIGGNRIHKAGEVLMLDDPRLLYLRLVSSSQHPEAIVIGGDEPAVAWTAPDTGPRLRDPLDVMMLRDAIGYLSDDILVKVDRASMAESLEVRTPFLDHRVAEFAWSLPVEYKVAAGQGKKILRQLLYKHVPQHLFERPKMGFAIPVARWLKEDLREWAEELLDPSRLRAQGYLEPTVVQNLWDSHLHGARDRQHELWGVLMFQSWLDAQDELQPS